MPEGVLKLHLGRSMEDLTHQLSEMINLYHLLTCGFGERDQRESQRMGRFYSYSLARMTIHTAFSALLCGTCAVLTAACCLSMAHQVHLCTSPLDSPSVFSSLVLPLLLVVRQGPGGYCETLVPC